MYVTEVIRGVIFMSDRLLKVSEVAEILRVSQMTVIRKCREGLLPFIRVGTMRRIREVDLDYYILNPNKKPKAPEPERPVYVGPPPELNGFYSEADEVARQKELTEQCAAAKPIAEAWKAKQAEEMKAPEPFVSGFGGKSTGLFPSGFDVLFDAYKE